MFMVVHNSLQDGNFYLSGFALNEIVDLSQSFWQSFSFSFFHFHSLSNKNFLTRFWFPSRVETINFITFYNFLAILIWKKNIFQRLHWLVQKTRLTCKYFSQLKRFTTWSPKGVEQWCHVSYWWRKSFCKSIVFFIYLLRYLKDFTSHSVCNIQ